MYLLMIFWLVLARMVEGGCREGERLKIGWMRKRVVADGNGDEIEGSGDEGNEESGVGGRS